MVTVPAIAISSLLENFEAYASGRLGAINNSLTGLLVDGNGWSGFRFLPPSARLLQHVGPFGMAAELCVGERAERDHRLAGAACILDGPSDQAKAGALAAESVVDVGMVDDDLVLADLGDPHLRLGPAWSVDDIDALRAIVLVADLVLPRTGHYRSPFAAIPEASGARKRCAAVSSAGRSSWPP